MTMVAKTVTPLRAELAERERESLTVAALRDTPQPMLISGELRLKDAERIAARADA